MNNGVNYLSLSITQQYAQENGMCYTKKGNNKSNIKSWQQGCCAIKFFVLQLYLT